MPEIRYQFVVAGKGEVPAEFRSITAEARASEKATAGMYRASVAGAGQATRSAQTYGREAKRPINDIERLAKKVAADQERAAKKAADTEIREAKRAAREKARAVEHVYQIRRRYEKELAKQEAAADKRRQAFSKKVVGTFGGAAMTLGMGAAKVGVGAGLAGAGLIGAAARDSMKLQDIANRISINSRGAGQRGVDATELRKEFEATAIATPGIKATDIAEGIGGFVAKTGDLAAARRFSGTFATTASASGADVQDIASAAADISQKFDVKSIDDMREALAALTFQGKEGAFELRDAAGKFAKTGAAAKQFGFSGLSGLKTLGGLSQIAMSATGDRDVASTAVEAMLSELTSAEKQKKINKLGQNLVFQKGSGNSKTRDIKDILVDIISKSGGNKVALGGIFGREGMRAVSPLISAFTDAQGAASGTKQEKTAAGVDALKAALDKAIEAPGAWSEVVKDAAQAQSSSSAKVTAAWEKIKATVGEKFAPAIADLVAKIATNKAAFDGLTAAVNAVVKALEYIGGAAKGFGFVEDDAMEGRKEAGEKAKRVNEELSTMLGGAGINTRAGQAAFAKLSPENQAKAKSLYSESLEAKALHENMTTAVTDQERAKRFTERYMSADPSEDKSFTEGYARGIVKRVASGEKTGFFDEMSDRSLETSAQTKERHEFEQGTGAYAKGGDIDNASKAAAEKMIAAADKFGAAADKIATAGGQPSITGAPLVGGTQ